MASYRLLLRLSALLFLGMTFSLAACSAATDTAGGETNAQNETPTPTPTKIATPTPTRIATPTPAGCGTRYSSGYITTIPDSNYKETRVYAQIQLPPWTRYYRDDASGHRYKFMCSGGTTDSVLSFMTRQLMQLGWNKVAFSNANPCDMIFNYGQPQCWKNGKYDLFMGINSNFDWVLAFLDPAFVQ